MLCLFVCYQWCCCFRCVPMTDTHTTHSRTYRPPPPPPPSPSLPWNTKCALVCRSKAPHWPWAPCEAGPLSQASQRQESPKGLPTANIVIEKARCLMSDIFLVFVANGVLYKCVCCCQSSKVLFCCKRFSWLSLFIEMQSNTPS